MISDPVSATIRAVGPGPVHIVDLHLSNQGFRFEAGQYVHVLHPSGAKIPFSIASAPSRLPGLEIHFQPTPEHPDSIRMQELLAGGTLCLDGVAGGTVINKATQTDVLFICAGSGFAQAAAMIDQALLDQSPCSISVLWCCDSREGFYAPERWYGSGRTVNKHLYIDPRRDSQNAASRWISKQAAKLALASDMFLCGSPAFVYAMTDLLIAGGVSANRMHSDVYDYAPRGGN